MDRIACPVCHDQIGVASFEAHAQSCIVAELEAKSRLLAKANAEIALCHQSLKAAADHRDALLNRNRELERVLAIARDRAVDLGDYLIKRGGMDQNRGQFLALVESVLKGMEQNDPG